jgi:hypothetical protein
MEHHQHDGEFLRGRRVTRPRLSMAVQQLADCGSHNLHTRNTQRSTEQWRKLHCRHHQLGELDYKRGGHSHNLGATVDLKPASNPDERDQQLRKFSSSGHRHHYSSIQMQIQ